MYSDLVALLIVREYATASSDYLRKQKEVDTETEFCIKSYSSAAAQVCVASFTIASLFLCEKKNQTN